MFKDVITAAERTKSLSDQIRGWGSKPPLSSKSNAPCSGSRRHTPTKLRLEMLREKFKMAATPGSPHRRNFFLSEA